MQQDIALADVTAQNWRAVVRLKLSEEQKTLVASNVYSIAESKFTPEARPRAIYAGDQVVGFMMYDLPEVDDEPQAALIYRFMVDEEHQRKGYGRAALQKAIVEIRGVPRVEKISISYMKDNVVAKKFYASFGFVEVPTKWEKEQLAELTL